MKRRLNSEAGSRESWLQAATRNLVPLFDEIFVSVHDFRVSCGFPSMRATGKKPALSESWPGSKTSDGMPQVFVSPVLSDSREILVVLLHEMVHLACPNDGHRREFARVARLLGFVPPLSEYYINDRLRARLKDLHGKLGDYPHAAVSPKVREGSGSRLRLWVCECGVKVRVADDDFRARCLRCSTRFRRKGT